MNTKRYMVGHDGSASGLSAVKMAADMARAFGADLEIVVVLREDHPFQQAYPPVGSISPMLEAQARTWLQEAAEVAAETRTAESNSSSTIQDLTVRTHVRRSRSVVAGLLETVAELEAAMIAISAGSRTGRLAVGPVADALLHSCPVPVALAPRRYRTGARPSHVYAAVGLRPGAQQVVREALEVAERTGFPLEVVSFLTDDDGAGRPGVVESVRDRVRETVAQIADAGRDIPIHVATGSSLKKAVAALTWQPGGVLVVGSSRLAQGRQLFLGTTAARLLRHLPIPMVVVPRPEPLANQERA